MLRFISLFTFLLVFQFNASSQISGYTDGWKKFENKLGFRCVGPFRGGRSAAVTGVEGNPMLFYMGATGGGVWKLSLIHI